VARRKITEFISLRSLGFPNPQPRHRKGVRKVVETKNKKVRAFSRFFSSVLFRGLLGRFNGLPRDSIIWAILQTIRATLTTVSLLLIILHPMVLLAALLGINQTGNFAQNLICYVVFLTDMAASWILGLYVNYLREQ